MAKKKNIISSKNPIITISKARIGSKLSLELNGFDNEINEWSIRDDFNGLLARKSLDKFLYGFYSPNTKVDLILYKDSVEVHTIKGILLLSGGENIEK